MIELNQSIKDELTRKSVSKETNFYSPYATKNEDVIFEKDNINYDFQSPFYSDINKIINSRAYNRYMGKTQVFFSDLRNDQICTRALHVQLVSNISRKICRLLGLNDELAEAIALGHDLGHTPFGHDGERAMNKILNEKGRYFRHSAHSVRILRDILGLDISIQVLDGIMCHNGESVKHNFSYNNAKFKTKERFFEEYNRAFTDKDFENSLLPMTMEGWVVRISDIIAYIGKDIEDAIMLKIITRNDLPKEAIEILGDTNADIVDSLINDLVNNSYGKETISFTLPVYEALMELRSFNYARIYSNSFVKSGTFRIQSMFEIMFDKYLRDLEKENKYSSIYNFIDSRSYRYDTPNEIIVTDYIAGMTDEFFEKEYKEFIMPEQVKLEMESEKAN